MSINSEGKFLIMKMGHGVLKAALLYCFHLILNYKLISLTFHLAFNYNRSFSSFFGFSKHHWWFNQVD